MGSAAVRFLALGVALDLFAAAMQLDNFCIHMGEDVIERLTRRHLAFLHEPRLDFGLEVLEGPEPGLHGSIRRAACRPYFLRSLVPFPYISRKVYFISLTKGSLYGCAGGIGFLV